MVFKGCDWSLWRFFVISFRPRTGGIPPDAKDHHSESKKSNRCQNEISHAIALMAWLISFWNLRYFSCFLSGKLLRLARMWALSLCLLTFILFFLVEITCHAVLGSARQRILTLFGFFSTSYFIFRGVSFSSFEERVGFYVRSWSGLVFIYYWRSVEQLPLWQYWTWAHFFALVAEF